MPSVATDNSAAPQYSGGYTAIVLAGKRPGIDPVAAAHNQTYKALVEVNGTPMLTRVIRALCGTKRIHHVILVAADDLGTIENITGLTDAFRGTPFSTSPARNTISDSVIDAINQRPNDSRFLITTSDHPLLTAKMVDDFLSEAEQQVGINIAFVNKAVIEAAYPRMNRTYLRLRDAEVSGANLFAISGSDGHDAIKFFQRIEANRKRPWKMISQFGVLNLVGFALRLFTLETAFRRVSSKLGCSVQPVTLSHANAAVDVDKVSDLETVNHILRTE